MMTFQHYDKNYIKLFYQKSRFYNPYFYILLKYSLFYTITHFSKNTVFYLPYLIHI